MTPSPNLTIAALKMVGALALVLGVLWVVYRWNRSKIQSGPGGGPGGLIRVVESRYLGVKKSISLVQVPGAVLVIGLGPEHITLLDKIENQDLIAEIETRGPLKGGVNFMSIFQRATDRQINPVNPTDTKR